MSSDALEAPGIGAPALAGLEPIETIESRWPMLIGAALTIAMVLGLAHELAGSGLAALRQSVPTNPGFYIAFGLLYLSLPLGDYIIFRRLWAIPIDGVAALVKKRIANEVVLGYSGEAYFYTWARQRSQLVSAPFGAVKDVSILSAIAGNSMTMLLTIMALPFAYDLLSPGQFRALLGSMAVMIAMSLPFLIFSRRVFSLPRAQLWWIFSVHAGRLIAGAVLLALAWHFALPQVPLGMWLLLSAVRMLVSRLPFVPNKDLLFANFAILFIGQDQFLSNVIGLTAALTLLVHVVLIGAFSLYSLIRNGS